MPRTLFRLATGAAALGAIVFASLVLWLRYDALPNADRFRERIVASIEKASGMAVSVRSIRGGWGGLRPVLSLEGLTITDRRGTAEFRRQVIGVLVRRAVRVAVQRAGRGA